ncbi:phospholipase D-like domain-containing protein [Sinorhizobium sp. 7-81]|uniref:phospholipase D-like domain-containing protein n=1 Tax=Sinorhizobium sp. 8-89 TaxID=3049089 RepID=UPI0024C3C2EE|nr:phospholipase D-like domain-containing protein [Sinorhizobium sp. 8-89]MDK1494086.1 phospholipase D-like domain-containing protein [Sinorhizobium sp. 8-89]
MRVRVEQNGIVVNAIAGCHVVTLGLDIAHALRQGLRGFAVRRTDRTEGEIYWMKGTKTFESVEPYPAPGEQFSSRYHPFQTFQWADYSAKPDHNYDYEVVALYGAPNALEVRASATVSVKTEPIVEVKHAVLFNRGAVATQEYARRFLNKRPENVGPGAYQWLSRGLLEGIAGFINRAKGPGFGLKGVFYEFQWPTVLEGLAAAKERGADVSIVFDDIESETGPWEKNENAIQATGISYICIPRRNGKLMHNKFLVLTRDGQPLALLTGSTNITENGIFGHANCVHIVEDTEVAARYLTYYEKLATDPETKAPSTYKEWTEQQTPVPGFLAPHSMSAIFSPRSQLDALDWYADIARAAHGGLFMTFAFGMNTRFRDVFALRDNVLRMALMEKEWNGRNKEPQIAAIRALQRLPNVVIAIGNRIPLSGFDQWLGELERVTKTVNIHWVHTKFLLADPLSDDPIVITGSANFSETSTTTNDENMLVIRGDTRVADIYFGEFMRLHSHYAFRQAVAIFMAKNPDKSPEDFNVRFLVEKDDWTRDYFDPNDPTGRYARRLYFSGTKNGALAERRTAGGLSTLPGDPSVPYPHGGFPPAHLGYGEPLARLTGDPSVRFPKKS